MTPSDTRLNALDLGFSGIGDTPWPITFRYYLSAPWGGTQQELSINAPLLIGRDDRAVALGRELWSASLAHASSVQVTLSYYDTMVWYSSAVPFVTPGQSAGGWRARAAAPREYSGQLVLCTGERRNSWRRRLFVAGMPSDWQQHGLLTEKGFEELTTLGRQLYIGLSGIYPDPVANWLVAYPNALESTLANPHGVGFKRITSVRVCEHTDRAPDLSPL